MDCDSDSNASWGWNTIKKRKISQTATSRNPVFEVSQTDCVCCHTVETRLKLYVKNPRKPKKYFAERKLMCKQRKKCCEFEMTRYSPKNSVWMIEDLKDVSNSVRMRKKHNSVPYKMHRQRNTIKKRTSFENGNLMKNLKCGISKTSKEYKNEISKKIYRDSYLKNNNEPQSVSSNLDSVMKNESVNKRSLNLDAEWETVKFVESVNDCYIDISGENPAQGEHYATEKDFVKEVSLESTEDSHISDLRVEITGASGSECTFAESSGRSSTPSLDTQVQTKSAMCSDKFVTIQDQPNDLIIESGEQNVAACEDLVIKNEDLTEFIESDQNTIASEINICKTEDLYYVEEPSQESIINNSTVSTKDDIEAMKIEESIEFFTTENKLDIELNPASIKNSPPNIHESMQVDNQVEVFEDLSASYENIDFCKDGAKLETEVDRDIVKNENDQLQSVQSPVRIPSPTTSYESYINYVTDSVMGSPGKCSSVNLPTNNPLDDSQKLKLPNINTIETLKNCNDGGPEINNILNVNRTLNREATVGTSNSESLLVESFMTTRPNRYDSKIKRSSNSSFHQKLLEQFKFKECFVVLEDVCKRNNRRRTKRRDSTRISHISKRRSSSHDKLKKHDLKLFHESVPMKHISTKRGNLKLIKYLVKKRSQDIFLK